MTWRPTISNVRRYTWRDGPNNKPGLALLNDQGNIMAHLTAEEALQLAHTIADTLQGGQSQPITEAKEKQ